jgi:hypothetical protein
MALVVLSPLITSASGKIGGVVFYRRNRKQFVRMYVIPRNPDTDAQRIVRRNFADAVKSWQMLPEDRKIIYIKKAKNLNMSGYNMFISQYLKYGLPARQKHTVTYIKGHKQPATGSRIILFPSVSYPYMLRSEVVYVSAQAQNDP